jgi:hypothetical protein
MPHRTHCGAGSGFAWSAGAVGLRVMLVCGSCPAGVLPARPRYAAGGGSLPRRPPAGSHPTTSHPPATRRLPPRSKPPPATRRLRPRCEPPGVRSIRVLSAIQVPEARQGEQAAVCSARSEKRWTSRADRRLPPLITRPSSGSPPRRGGSAVRRSCDPGCEVPPWAHAGSSTCRCCTWTAWCCIQALGTFGPCRTPWTAFRSR